MTVERTFQTQTTSSTKTRILDGLVRDTEVPKDFDLLALMGK